MGKRTFREIYKSRSRRVYYLTIVSEGDDFKDHLYTAQWECQMTSEVGKIGYSVSGRTGAALEARLLIVGQEWRQLAKAEVSGGVRS